MRNVGGVGTWETKVYLGTDRHRPSNLYANITSLPTNPEHQNIHMNAFFVQKDKRIKAREHP